MRKVKGRGKRDPATASGDVDGVARRRSARVASLRGVACVLTAAVIAFPATASAQVAIMPKITTGLGIGADLGVALGDWIVVRAGAAGMPFEPEFEVSGIDFAVKTPLSAVGAVDLHLGGTGFRVSGGLFWMADDVVVTANLGEEVEIGGETWTAEEVGELTGEFFVGETLPFVSAGYGRAAGRGVGFFLEAGVAFFGESTVAFDAEGGTRSEDEDFQNALRSQESVTERDLDDFGMWPLLTVGIRIGL